MSYGKWKALHPHTEVKEEQDDDNVLRCKICGDVIPKRSGTSGRQRKTYCSMQCSYEGHKARERLYSQMKKERMMADGKI